MEAAAAAARNLQRCGRKRARDDDDEDEIILQAKKQDQYSSSINSYNNDDDDDDERVGRYRFHDGIGVFDFPWLKDGGEEGVIFDSEPPSTFEEKYFTPVCDETHRFCDETSYSQQNLCVSPAGGVDGNDHDNDGSAKNDDVWSSLAVDDLGRLHLELRR